MMPGWQQLQFFAVPVCRCQVLVGGGIGYAGVACMLMCLLDPKMAMLPG